MAMGMGSSIVVVVVDMVLVPLSIFVIIGYHIYLWQSFKNRQSQTTIGIDVQRRKLWFSSINIQKDDDKKGMQAVQTLRNTLMGAILIAAVAILINVALGALANNSYKANNLLKNPTFGSHSDKLYVLKFGLASIFALFSFLCNSMAIGYLVDANFLVNAFGEYSSIAHTKVILECGFMLSIVGNRALCVAFPLIIWLLGPIPMFLSSVALVYGLYEIDFVNIS